MCDQIWNLFSKYKLEDTKDFVQIIFFVITASAAWLSYRAAKKSIFAQQKTEVFKKYLDEILEIYSIFHVLDSREFYRRFDFRYVQVKNVELALYDYALCANWRETDGSKAVIKKRIQEVLSSADFVHSASSEKRFLYSNARNEKINPKWEERPIKRLIVGANQKRELDKIKYFARSALIQSELSQKLNEFVNIVESINDLIEESIFKSKDCISSRCSNLNNQKIQEEIDNGLSIILSDQLMGNDTYITMMKKASEDITNYISSCLDVDKISKNKI